MFSLWLQCISFELCDKHCWKIQKIHLTVTWPYSKFYMAFDVWRSFQKHQPSKVKITSSSSSTIIVRPLSRITTMGECTPLRARNGAASGMRWWYPRWRRLQEESSTQVTVLTTHRVTHRVRLHLAISLLHLLCNQKLHRTRLVQPIGLVDRLSVFKKVHLVISSFLKVIFEAVDKWYADVFLC